MSKPAKDEAALLKRAGEAIRKALIKPPGCTESTGCAVGPCHCAHVAADAALAEIRAAGWAVVPQAQLEILCAENERQREALSEIAANAANPGHAQEQCKAIWRMARLFAGEAEP
jgi:hypothetical protein